MGTFLVYIIKSALCLTLLYLPYTLLLRKERLHRLNRMALLAILAASFSRFRRRSGLAECGIRGSLPHRKGRMPD